MLAASVKPIVMPSLIAIRSVDHLRRVISADFHSTLCGVCLNGGAVNT